MSDHAEPARKPADTDDAAAAVSQKAVTWDDGRYHALLNGRAENAFIRDHARALNARPALAAQRKAAAALARPKRGLVAATRQPKGVAINDDPRLEREADVMGARASTAPPRVGAVEGRAHGAAPASAAQLRPAVLQLAKLHVRPAHQAKLPGTISGVTFASRPSSNSIIQAQHITAYVAFESMIFSNVADQDLPGAATALKALLPEIKKFITASSRTQYLLDGLDAVDVVLDAALDFSINGDDKSAQANIEWAIDEILSIRNKVPGSAKNTKNTGGHDESGSNSVLTQVETALRETGQLDSSWKENVVAKEAGLAMWRLMDAHPVKGSDPDDLAPVLEKHIIQMAISFPRVFAWLSTKQAWYLRTWLASGEKGLPVAQFDDEQIAEVQQLLADAGY